MTFLSTFLLKFWLLCFLYAKAQANVWDNIFGAFRSPLVQFPKSWETTLGYSNSLFPMRVTMAYCSELKMFKAELYLDMPYGQVNASSIILNITNNSMVYHSPDGCKFVQTPNLVSSTLNSSDLTNLFRLIAFYNGKTPLGQLKYDISSFFSLLNFDKKNQIFAFFDEKNMALSYIDFSISAQNFRLYALSPLKARTFENSFFDIPSSWGCVNSASNYITDVQLADIFKTMLDFLKNNQRRLRRAI